MKKFLFVLGISAAIFACGEGSGNAADKGADTPGTDNAGSEVQNQKGLELIGASDCTTCHDIDAKKIGPAYVEVAKRYESSPAVIDTLVSKIINGGAGNWGTIAMTSHPTLSKEDATEMVKYILSLKNR